MSPTPLPASPSEPGTGPEGWRRRWSVPAPARVLAMVLATAPGPAGCSDAPTAVGPPGARDVAAPWETATPAEAEMDPAGLEAAAEAAAEVGAVRSLLVVRRGRLVLERYFGGTDATTPADVRSVTKSVVSLLTGIALDRGELTGLDQPVAGILEPAGFALRPEHRAVTVEHLLEMTGGFEWDEAGTDVATYNEWVGSPDPVTFLLDRPLAAPPGEVFAYNSAAVHLLGVVLEAATGRALPDYADEVLFAPLGIQLHLWEPLGGRVNGGSGLDLLPRDLARLGQLMLQEGWSGERQVVPAPWVEASTERRFAWERAHGPMPRVSYGLLWWLDLARDAFFAEGFRGQFLYVAPELELVIVATTDLRGGLGRPPAAELRDAVASLLVDHVLPAAR